MPGGALPLSGSTGHGDIRKGVGAESVEAGGDATWSKLALWPKKSTFLDEFLETHFFKAYFLWKFELKSDTPRSFLFKTSGS